MKKKILLFLLLIVVFPIYVYASNVPLCEYTETINNSDGTTTSVQITMGFNSSNQKFYFKHPSKSGLVELDKQFSLQELSSTGKDDLVHMDEDSYKLLESGKCPQAAYMDLSNYYTLTHGWVGDAEICFGDLDSYCNTLYDNGGAKNNGNEFKYYSAALIHSTSSTQLSTDNFTKESEIIVKQVKNKLTAKYKVDTTKSYEENTICQNLKKNGTAEESTTKLIDDMNENRDYWVKYFTEEAGSILGNLYQTRVYSNSEDPYEVSSLANELYEKCVGLIDNSNMSEEEKTQEKEELGNGLSSTQDYILKERKTFVEFSFTADFTGAETCEGIFGSKDDVNSPMYYINLALNIIRYAGIILTLVLSTVDFVKAITSKDKDLLQKAALSSAKRLIFAVIIFFLPILINFVLGIIDSKFSTCI